MEGTDKMNEFVAKGLHFPLNDRTYIMGILNITPDSFSDGGIFNEREKAIDKIQSMINAGADIIDIGAQSTAPGSAAITYEQEIHRLNTVIGFLPGGVAYSIDTFHPQTAHYALQNGFHIVNDVSGSVSPEMAAVVKNHASGWIIMHTGGGNADTVVKSDESIEKRVLNFFKEALEKTRLMGISSEHICLDPGIGFGKTQWENIQLLVSHKQLHIDGVALLTGASRKRVIGEYTGVTDPTGRLGGTIAAHTLAIMDGADFIRIHDVYEGAQAAKFANAARKLKSENGG